MKKLIKNKKLEKIIYWTDSIIFFWFANPRRLHDEEVQECVILEQDTYQE